MDVLNQECSVSYNRAKELYNGMKCEQKFEVRERVMYRYGRAFRAQERQM